LTSSAIAEYLANYAANFQEEYRRLTAFPPAGAGYPALQVSPYLGPGTLDVIVSPDGVAIYRLSPDDSWLATGPGLVVDTESRRSAAGTVTGPTGKFTGLYLVVSKTPLSDEIWSGSLGPLVDEAASRADQCEFRVRLTDLTRIEVLQRLTFGAFGCILDLHLRGPETALWKPLIVRRLGFVTAGGKHRRFFEHLELSPHVDAAAWDRRAIPTRVQVDVRYAFGSAFALAGRNDGTIDLNTGAWVQPFFDRLSVLESLLGEFESLLHAQSEGDERIFHSFIEEHPILLDIYAQPISKPRWPYPPGTSPLGKSYVEPDFVLKYPDGSYRLVELERPNKELATVQGQPRAGVNQAAFQIAEWRAYIANHYDLLKAEYPGISDRQSATIVIGRSSSTGVGRSLQQYKELLASQYQTVDVLTYDELLERARHAYAGLTSLAIGDGP